ncbi:hypothetical protein FQZ97_1061400 [compost metagenome]
MAGAGRNHQRALPVCAPLRGCPGVRIGGYRQVPHHLGLFQAEGFAEAADRVEHVDAGPVRDAFVDDDAMQVLRAAAVIADPAPGRNEGRQQVGAQGHLHLQQSVESSGRQRAAQGPHAGQPGLLVVGVEGHTFQPFEQLESALVDHPLQVRPGPVPLQGAHQRHDMGHVAECGQAKQAE